MYQALYRKYRPRTFSDVFGQEHVTATLQRQVMSGRLSHAYLFVGTRGTGKTTCAKVLSRAINCENPVDGDPCNKCPSCIGIENGSILDVLELDAASNNKVDDVRALREEAIYSPANVDKRVYIIDEVHMLSNQAFDALLKILEEPPEHLVFILATTALHKVPATILSRCQRFSFKRLSTGSIAARLHYVAENEGFELTEEAVDELAFLADGSMRDALSLLDQCASDKVVDLQHVLDTIGIAGQQEVLKLVQAAASGDTTVALSILDRIYGNGRDMISLLSEMATLIRDTLLFKLSAESPLISRAFERGELSALAEVLSPQRLFSYLDTIREAGYDISRSAATMATGTKLPVEMALIKMCYDRISDDMGTLLSRIEQLENAAAPRAISRGFAQVSADAVSSTSTDNESAQQKLDIAAADEDADVAFDDTSVDVGSTAEIEAAVNGTVEVDAADDAVVGAAEVDVDCTRQNSRHPSGTISEMGFWASVLEQLKGDISIHSLLSDSERIQGELRDNDLIIRAGDLFIIGLIESRKFMDPLKDAARKVLGHDPVIRIEAGLETIDDNMVKKIADLERFDVVKFE